MASSSIKSRRVMPAFKQQILGQTNNILKKAPASPSLNPSPLIAFIDQMENGRS
jgi:hypothetical protein